MAKPVPVVRTEAILATWLLSESGFRPLAGVRLRRNREVMPGFSGAAAGTAATGAGAAGAAVAGAAAGGGASTDPIGPGAVLFTEEFYTD